METGNWIHSRALAGHRSEAKKRSMLEVENVDAPCNKRVKMRDLESVLISEGREETSIVHGDVNSNARALDLNVEVGTVNCMVHDDAPVHSDVESKFLPFSGKEEEQLNGSRTKAKRLDFDLNAEDTSTSVNDPFHPSKSHGHSKWRVDSEHRSMVVPLRENDSMNIWKGLKQNSFMSTPSEIVPVGVPKQRGRKKAHNDAMKKKIELAKKEQADRFARLAAPSGLLNGLNPGIINHVRNSKQVRSIIEALVKSERDEKQLSGSNKSNQLKSGGQELTGSKEELEHYGRSGFGHVDSSLGIRQLTEYCVSGYPNSEIAKDSEAWAGKTRIISRVPSHSNARDEVDKIALRVSSSVTVASENASCLSNDESANLGTITSLSVKAANVATQWLDLMSQDIRGRLAALRRSKKRVRGVISTELPFLISREFTSNHHKDAKENVVCLDRATADAHFDKWSHLFGQMDKALCEEESHLEIWLNQVKEVQLHCEKGLNRNSSCHASHEGNDIRFEETDNLEKNLAVRAAAASIYSTCNYLFSAENLHCF